MVVTLFWQNAIIPIREMFIFYRPGFLDYLFSFDIIMVIKTQEIDRRLLVCVVFLL